MLCINLLSASTKNKSLIRFCRKSRISIDLLIIESVRIFKITIDFFDSTTIWYAFLKSRSVLFKNQSNRLVLQLTTTERFSDTILSKIPVRLIWFDRKIWHGSVENIDHSSTVISEGVCLAIDAILSAKSTPRLPVSIFVCLSTSYLISQNLNCNLSLQILQPAINFWRFVCLPASLRHQSKPRHYVCNRDSEENALSASIKFHLSQHLTRHLTPRPAPRSASRSALRPAFRLAPRPAFRSARSKFLKLLR